MGRPSRYSTEAERLEARRQQTRLHVRAHRQRQQKKNNAQALSRETGSRRNSSNTARNVYRLFESDHFMHLSPTSTDFWKHSHLSAIDLSFDAKAHVLHIFTTEEQSWPWTLAMERETQLQTSREVAHQHIVDTATFAAAALYARKVQISYTRPNMYSRAMALEAFHYTLQNVQKWLKLASDPDIALLVSTANNAMWGAELVESHRGHASHHAWLSHMYGSFQIANAAGPAAFAGREGIMMFKNIEPRLLAMSFRDRKPCLDEKAWYDTLFADISMTTLNKLCSILARIPRNLQYIDVLRETVKDPPQLRSALSLVLARLKSTQKALNTWLTREAPNGGNVNVESSKNIFGFAEDVAKCMQTRNVFEDGAAMWTMITYWHYYSRLLMEILDIHDVIYAPTEATSTNSGNAAAQLREQLRNELSTCITNISRSAEAVFSDLCTTTWWIAIFLVSIPIRSVLQYLQRNSEMMEAHKDDYQWCLAVAGSIRPVSSRFSVGEYAADGIIGKVDGLPCIE